jgi:hypothetical protein
MLIRFRCVRCDERLAVNARQAGAEIACPQCGFSQVVSAEDEPADADEGGLSPFVRSTQRAVPANGDCPLPSRRAKDAAEETASGGETFPIPTAEFTGSCELRVPAVAPHRAPRMPADKILFPRRMLYVEGVLYAVVALGAFAAGYLVGRGGTSDANRRFDPSPRSAHSAAFGPAAPARR